MKKLTKKKKKKYSSCALGSQQLFNFRSICLMSFAVGIFSCSTCGSKQKFIYLFIFSYKSIEERVAYRLYLANRCSSKLKKLIQLPQMNEKCHCEKRKIPGKADSLILVNYSCLSEAKYLLISAYQ